MQEKVYLGIKNHDTGDYYVTACTLPAQIGRQHDMRNQVLLDPQYRTISRIHGMIERTSRGFVYTDSSTSGSRVGGLVVRDSRVALAPTFHIEIENYTISRVDMTPFVIYATTDKLVEVQALEVLPGRGVGIATLDEVAEARKRYPTRKRIAEIAGRHTRAGRSQSLDGMGYRDHRPLRGDGRQSGLGVGRSNTADRQAQQIADPAGPGAHAACCARCPRDQRHAVRGASPA